MDRQDRSDEAFVGVPGIREWDGQDHDFILDWILEAEDLCEIGAYEVAFDICGDLLKQLDSHENEDLAELTAEVILCSGRCLAGMERFEDELEAYNELVNRFESLDFPQIVPLVCRARFNAAVVTGELGRTEESIEMNSSFVKRYKDKTSLEIQCLVARAWYNLSITLKQSNRLNESLHQLTQLINRYQSILKDPEDSVTIVRALISRMVLELDMGKVSAAIRSGTVGLAKCSDELVHERFHLHLVLTAAYFIAEDRVSAESHVLKFLGLLPEISEPSVFFSAVSLLRTATLKIGVDRVVELILRSASAQILSPVVEELRQSPSSLTGIKEVAKDLKIEFSSLGRFVN